LFYFLHRELGLSKSAAFQRMTAAQLIHKYPEVVEPLRDGRLCLSTVTEVSPTPPSPDLGPIIGVWGAAVMVQLWRALLATTAERLSPEAAPVDGAPRAGRP
jgi:hypothetical protein